MNANEGVLLIDEKTSDFHTHTTDTEVVGIALIISLLAMIIIVLGEIWLMAAAAVWAIAGILHLSLLWTGLAATPISVASLWASWHTIRLVIASRSV